MAGRDQDLNKAYGVLIYDLSALLATRYQDDPVGLAGALFRIGVPVPVIFDIARWHNHASKDGQLWPVDIRGFQSDEGLYEYLKDALRPRFGF